MNITGKYGTAIVYTDMIEQEAIDQIQELMNQPFADMANVRIMPDVHAGAGCVIGTTMIVHDEVCPNLVGVDIGCGMITVNLNTKASDINLAELDAIVHEQVPSGFNVHGTPHLFERQQEMFDGLSCKERLKNKDRLYASMGTLGGGNHFTEVAADDDGNAYLVIHSGSRNLGLQIAKHYQGIAVKNNKGVSDEDVKKRIQELKNVGLERTIPDEIKAMKAIKPPVPDALATLKHLDLYEYLHDLQIAQVWASLNRKTIAGNIVKALTGKHLDELGYFQTIHNYIDYYNILRKGAVSAHRNEQLLIPINMRDGSIIAIGKGNPDWNYSAPHGAGRLMSRRKAFETLSVDDFKDTMQNIYSSTVGKATLDEAPMAYKPMESILENIKDTVTVEKIIRPIYNYKAADDKD